MAHSYDDDHVCVKCGCGIGNALFNGIKCVPDDQPVVQETYDARRKRIAAERNPGQGQGQGQGQGHGRVRWSYVGSPQSWNTGEEIVYATQDDDGFWSFTSWSSGPDTSGIARAVDNLNQHESRFGSSRWSPE
jgi:hypothetical protein